MELTAPTSKTLLPRGQTGRHRMTPSQRNRWKDTGPVAESLRDRPANGEPDPLDHFPRLVAERHLASLRLAAYFAMGLLPLYWLLHWAAVSAEPRRVQVLRGALFALAVLTPFASKIWRGHCLRHADRLTTIQYLGMGALVGYLDLLRGGYVSVDFAGLILVVLASGLLYTWTPRRAVSSHAALYLAYLLPLASGIVTVSDWHGFGTCQFYILGAMVLAAFAQHRYYTLLRNGHDSRRDLEALADQLLLLATTDDLSGLFSRRHYFELGTAEVERARRHRRPLTAVLLDVDRFKLINDRFGHSAGDQVIRALGRELRLCLRKTDIAARYGGDELMLLLPETDARAATEMIEKRVARALGAVAVEGDANHHYAITVSAGVAELGPGAKDLTTVLEHADAALYEAKRRGRNRVVVWDAELVDPPAKKPAPKPRHLPQLITPEALLAHWA